MNQSIILQALDLKKDYKLGEQTVHALKGVSIKIYQGEFVAVMGPSGSGKSTFMNILGCLDTPTSGSLFLQSQDVALLDANQLAVIRNKNIGFVFQQFNLLKRTSALDNVCLPLFYSGETLSKEVRQQKAHACLAKVGLANREDHHPSQLSGGQQQRVAIARSLVNSPVMMLADEPTGALDTQTGIEIMALFQELNQQGMTIILVTHEAEIAAVAKRQLLFRDGLLVSDEVNDNPRDVIAEAQQFKESVA